jgi:hypothetical protein
LPSARLRSKSRCAAAEALRATLQPRLHCSREGAGPKVALRFCLARAVREIFVIFFDSRTLSVRTALLWSQYTTLSAFLLATRRRALQHNSLEAVGAFMGRSVDRFAERKAIEESGCVRGLVRPDARELHHLGPFLNVLGDELAELGGRTCKPRVAKVCNPRFHTPGPRARRATGAMLWMRSKLRLLS